MGNAVVLAFYITVCFVVFVISKIIIAVLLYKRWKRKQMVYEDGFSGMGEKSQLYIYIYIYSRIQPIQKYSKEVMCYSDVVCMHTQVGRW
jgi:hypothetical protein